MIRILFDTWRATSAVYLLTYLLNGKKAEASNRSRLAEHLKNRYGADNSKMRNSYEMRLHEAGGKTSDSKIQCYGCGMFGHKANSCPAKHKDVRNEMQRIVPQSYGRNNIRRGRLNDHEKLEGRHVDSSDENCDGQMSSRC